MLICRGTDAQMDGWTDARTHGQTENIYSIFRDKLLLLGEHGFHELKYKVVTATKVVGEHSPSNIRARGMTRQQ
jgi:hypothetical protein